VSEVLKVKACFRFIRSISHEQTGCSRLANTHWRPGYLTITLADKVPRCNITRFFLVGHSEGKVKTLKPLTTNDLKKNLPEDCSHSCRDVTCILHSGASPPLVYVHQMLLLSAPYVMRCSFTSTEEIMNLWVE
jgi:hypothetical protein